MWSVKIVGRDNLWLLHQLADGDEVDEFAEGVVLRLPIGLQSAKSGLVSESERAAEGVGKETVGKVVREQLGVIYEIGSDVGGATNGLAAVLAGGVDGGSVWVGAAEVADGVIGFEGVAERIDLGVAVGTGLNIAMLFQLLTDRRGAANVGLDGRYVRWRWTGRCSKKLFKQPDTTRYR